MKMKVLHFILLLFIFFALGFMANETLLEGKLPIEFPILFGSAAFFLLATRNSKIAKIRIVLTVLILIIGIITFIFFLQNFMGDLTPV